jgi:hypothetical protein
MYLVLTLGILTLVIASALAVSLAVRTAREGYEDNRGFHGGRRTAR